MSVIVNLTSFAGTNGQTISAGDADWNLHTNYTGTMTLIDGRARQTTTTNPGYYRSEVPGNADQTVRAGVYFLSSTTAAVGVAARFQTAANTFFLAQYVQGTVKLYRFVAGTGTQIGSSVVVTPPGVGAVKDLELSVSGVSPNIAATVKWDGSAVITPTGIDVAALDAAGRVGVRCGTGGATTDTTGVHLSSFYAEDTTVGSGDGAASAAFPVVSLTAPSATATGTGAAGDGASAGPLAVSTLSAPSATATGTAPGVGTVSIPPITDFGSRTVLVGVTNITADFYDVTTKALVVSVTGLTSNATTGAASAADALLSPGTTYRTVVEFTYLGLTYRGVWNLVAS